MVFSILTNISITDWAGQLGMEFWHIYWFEQIDVILYLLFRFISDSCQKKSAGSQAIF